MSEQQQMLADMVGGLFAELGAEAMFRRDWPRIADVELTGLLVGEAGGGFGGGWDDAAAVFRLAGRTALNLPVVEAIVAHHLAERAGWACPPGLGSIAGTVEGVFDGGRFSGAAVGVPWGLDAAYVALPAPGGGGGLLIDAAGASIQRGENPAGEPRDTLRFGDAEAIPVGADVHALGAFARTAQIAGALDAALALSVGYVNERQQFGRSIAKFQAVQQALATFACEAAAADVAAAGAAQALIGGDAAFEIGAAKLRANMAIGHGTAIAHQVHGAIGFTEEYALHPLTRRLWSWRSEFGSDAFWSARLGDWAADRGANGFWSAIADRTDPPETA